MTIEKNWDETALTGFGSYPDMLPIARQVMIATDTAQGLAGRLVGVEIF